MLSQILIDEPQNESKVIAYLQPVLQESPAITHPAVIICPGGAYWMISERENLPVAKKYYGAGYHVFVLDQYPVRDKAKGYAPLQLLARSIAMVREHAQEWLVEENHIAVCGFSAGGHLAASLGTLYDDEQFLQVCKTQGNIRPDAMILCYPVITAGEFAHADSICNVSGNVVGTPEYKYWSLEKHVDANTPPTFLWHTAPDDLVPVENSLAMAMALSAAKVPFEMHIFPEGGHGMSVCTTEVGCLHPYNSRWVDLSIAYLNRLFDFAE